MHTFRAFLLLCLASPAWASDEPHAEPRLLKAPDLPVEVEPAALQRQYDALRVMRLQAIQYSSRGPVHYMKGDTGVILPPDVVNLAIGDGGKAVLHLFRDILLATGSETLTVTDAEVRTSSTHRLMFSQSIRGIPVVHGVVGIEYDGTTRRVTDFIASFIPDRGLPEAPRISATRAEQVVAETLAFAKDTRANEMEIIAETYLAYYAVYADASAPCLVWVVEADFGGTHERFFVDAVSERVVDSQALSLGLTRKVYNANGTSPAIPSGLPGAMSSGEIQADPWGYQAWFDIGEADLALRQRLPLATSRFPTKTHQVVRYLETPGALHKIVGADDYIWYSIPSLNTNSPTNSPDITYHEYAHGVGKRTTGFDGDAAEYLALHEGFADIGATVVDVAIRGAPAAATWRIAEGFYVYPGVVLRSLANPRSDSWPPTGDWFPQRLLFGKTVGHANSTILTHAYYLSIYGGLHSRVSAPEIPEITVPALSPLPVDAEARAREIFVRAFDDISMKSAPSFAKLKSAAVASATPFGLPAAESIRQAFAAVGVCGVHSAPPAVAPLVTIVDHSCAGQFDASWPAVPAADRYFAEVKVPVLGWAFAAPVSDVTETQCSFQVSQDVHYRIRACNDCGCGPWSPTRFLEYHMPCL